VFLGFLPARCSQGIRQYLDYWGWRFEDFYQQNARVHRWGEISVKFGVVDSCTPNFTSSARGVGVVLWTVPSPIDASNLVGFAQGVPKLLGFNFGGEFSPKFSAPLAEKLHIA